MTGLAAFAWPVIARFFTFATIQAADSGVGALLGLATGAIASRAGGGSTAGGGSGGGTVLGGIGFALQKLHRAGTLLAGDALAGPVAAGDGYDGGDARWRARRHPAGPSDPLRAAEVAEKLDAGTVRVNTHMQLTHDASFTGMKHSGLGSEMGLWSIYASTPQTVYRTRSEVIKKGTDQAPEAW